MKILISGASGFIGRALISHLRKEHQVLVLVRDPSKVVEGKTVFWDVEQGIIETDEGIDAIINLAGEGIFSGRWTKKKKEAILSSRLKATNLLVQFALSSNKPLSVLINASAVGFYGTHPSQLVTEESSNGEGFLADVCEQWEKATLPLQQRAVRTALLRFGAVLGKGGGVLQKMLLPFKLSLGTILGDGSQWMSWIALDDLVRAIEHVLKTPSLDGPINVVSPYPVSQREFANTLAVELHRPLFFSIGKSIIILIFGQMGEELLLASQRVSPTKLQNSGFSFDYPTLKEAMHHIVSGSS
ncbi:MAG: TIGR01777 family oxidoreductase [Chlamydiales bacterium]|nr:TIGR01777 family oxidoreductase [Chlamydiales bacterium]